MKRITLLLLCALAAGAGGAAAQTAQSVRPSFSEPAEPAQKRPLAEMERSEQPVSKPAPLPSASPLTLDRCVELARANNRRLQAADRQVEAQRFELRSARALLFPSLGASGTAFYGTTDGRIGIAGGMLPVVGADGVPTGASAYFPGLDLNYDLGWLYGGGVQLEQPLYLGGKVRTGYRMAGSAYRLALENRRRSEAETVVETSRAYADVVRAQELCKVAEAAHALLGELQRSVQRAFREGMKPRSEVLKVEVKYRESERNLLRSAHARRLAAMYLNRCIGRPLTDSLAVEGSLPEAEEAGPGATGIADRPELRMLDAQYELQRRQVELTRAERRPQVALVGRYGYLGGLGLNGGTVLHGWSFLAGVRLSVPLFHFGRHTNRVRAAEARFEQFRAEREDACELLELEAARAADNLEEAQLEVRLAEAEVRSADEHLRASRRRYEAGFETLSDYLEAQALWQQAQQQRVEAQTARYVRLLEYRRAVGRID